MGHHVNCSAGTYPDKNEIIWLLHRFSLYHFFVSALISGYLQKNHIFLRLHKIEYLGSPMMNLDKMSGNNFKVLNYIKRAFGHLCVKLIVNTFKK